MFILLDVHRTSTRHGTRLPISQRARLHRFMMFDIIGDRFHLSGPNLRLGSSGVYRCRLRYYSRPIAAVILQRTRACVWPWCDPRDMWFLLLRGTALNQKLFIATVICSDVFNFLLIGRSSSLCAFNMIYSMFVLCVFIFSVTNVWLFVSIMRTDCHRVSCFDC